MFQSLVFHRVTGKADIIQTINLLGTVYILIYIYTYRKHYKLKYGLVVCIIATCFWLQRRQPLLQFYNKWLLSRLTSDCTNYIQFHTANIAPSLWWPGNEASWYSCRSVLFYFHCAITVSYIYIWNAIFSELMYYVHVASFSCHFHGSPLKEKKFILQHSR